MHFELRDYTFLIARSAVIQSKSWLNSSRIEVENRRMKDSLVDRFTSSREDQWIPKHQVFQVLRKFPLYLSTFSGRWPSSSTLLSSPSWSMADTKRKGEIEKKELKEMLAAVRWMYYMSWWPIRRITLWKSQRFSRSIERKFYPRYVIYLRRLARFSSSIH